MALSVNNKHLNKSKLHSEQMTNVDYCNTLYITNSQI